MSSKPRHKRRKARNLVELEPLFQGVREALTHDLADSNLRRLYGLKGREEWVQPVSDGCPPYVFKKIQQLLNFDKRVIWKSDAPFELLAAEAFNGFRKSQLTFSCPEPMNLRETLVIQTARKICSDILGQFSMDEWLDSCSFGKRAAVALPRREAYLDVRFERLNGTPSQLAVFNEMLARDIHLLRAVRKKCRRRQVNTLVKATAVPKSWKAARIIAPDSTLGGLLSRGLGLVIRRRLEENTHIDLARQQERHRRWALLASISGYLATLDLSKASDSFVWRHIELIVPEDWHAALECVRSPLCEVNGEVIPLRSYMLMGSGHTFPLQTLLFYCLAEGVRTLLKCRGKVSVYGDDIIVPTRMSTHLIVILEGLGFTINSEKSFYDSPDPDRPSHTFFRESCGGDYKGGVDVRPYMPECNLQEEAKVPRNTYIAWCHKMINGLLDRWSLEEIPLTVAYLMRCITNMKRKICFVPAYEVDHAGIRHFIAPQYLLGFECSFITYKHSIPTYYRLVFHQRKRPRNLFERPYVWYAYWLARNPDAELPGSYSTPISLGGEPDRARKGAYCWKTTERKR